jgi:hypothetical protein
MAARRTRSRLWVRCAFVLVAAGVLAACAGSGYTYVSSKSTRTFLKVPDSWKVFKKDEVLAEESDYLVYDKDDRFLVAFDGSPKPSLNHSFVTGKYPFGQVRVRSLDMSEHDQYSLVMLRNEVIPIDDLLQSDSSKISLLAPQQEITRHGLRGTRLEYSVETPQEKFRMSQVGFIDAGTRTVWFLAVGCTPACYERHKGAIHRVLDSWTVEGK